MVRIALVVTDLENGGTPLRLARLAVGLRDAGVEVQVGCLAPPGPVSARLEAAGIRTFAAGASSAWDLPAVVRLGGWLRGFQPDVVHSSLMHANTAARLVCRALGIPVICSTVTIEVERPWHITVERLLAPLEDARVANSAAVAQHVVAEFGIPSEAVHVLPPLIAEARSEIVDRRSARARYGLPADGFVILWAGRFDAVKRIEVVVDVLGLLDANVRAVLAGDGPERGRIEKRVAARGLRERVRCTGWLERLDEVVAAADVLLLPSRTEGMPNVALEALRGGLPVIGSDIPALRALRAAAGAAFTLVSGESPEDFAVAVRRLIEQPELRAQQASAAREAGARLAQQNGIAATIALYQRVIAECGAR